MGLYEHRNRRARIDASSRHARFGDVELSGVHVRCLRYGLSDLLVLLILLVTLSVGLSTTTFFWVCDDFVLISFGKSEFKGAVEVSNGDVNRSKSLNVMEGSIQDIWNYCTTWYIHKTRIMLWMDITYCIDHFPGVKIMVVMTMSSQ